MSLTKIACEIANDTPAPNSQIAAKVSRLKPRVVRSYFVSLFENLRDTTQMQNNKYRFKRTFLVLLYCSNLKWKGYFKLWLFKKKY